MHRRGVPLPIASAIASGRAQTEQNGTETERKCTGGVQVIERQTAELAFRFDGTEWNGTETSPFLCLLLYIEQSSMKPYSYLQMTLTNQKTQEQRQDKWTLLCQHSQQLNQNVDWVEAARQLPQPLLLSCPNWIKHTKVATDGSITRPQCTPVDKLFEWTTDECISDCVHTLYWK